jgi:hypothetical protein
MSSPHRVAIVADRQFTELETLSRAMHVWICSSPFNKESAQRIWRAAQESESEVTILDEGSDLESGVTTFDVSPTANAEEIVIGILSTVDEHHSEYSHDPPWSILEVYGVHLTPGLKVALGEFGVTEYEARINGFTCRRAVRSAA